MAPRSRRLPNGESVVSLNRHETDYLYKEIFEDQAYLLDGPPALTDHPVIFDVGANIGLFSLFAARQWPESTIFAFEPIPQIFEALEHNLSDLSHATPHRMALGSERGMREIVYYPRYTMMSGFDADSAEDRSLVARYVRNSVAELADQEMRTAVLEGLDGMLAGRFEQEIVPVRVERICDVAADLGIAGIDLLKVDVEGAELQVLQGIGEQLWPSVGNAVVEVADRDGELKEIVELLNRHGLRTTVRQFHEYRETELFMIFAQR